jgi:hypothetical protein
MPISLQIDTSELQAVVKKIAAYGETGRKLLDLDTKATAFEAERVIKQNTPVRTGDTRRSWQTEAGQGGSDYLVASNSKVAVFLEEGTKAHVVYPKTKKALAFAWDQIFNERTGGSLNFRASGKLTEGSLKSAGNLAFAVFKKVKIPAMKAKNIVLNAIPKVMSFFEDRVNKTISDFEAGL